MFFITTTQRRCYFFLKKKLFFLFLKGLLKLLSSMIPKAGPKYGFFFCVYEFESLKKLILIFSCCLLTEASSGYYIEALLALQVYLYCLFFKNGD